MIAAETGRLLLRSLTLGDLDALAAIEADPEVMRFYPSGPRTRDQARGDILRCMEVQDAHGFSLYAAVSKADGHLVGRCGLLPQSLGEAAEVEVAYMIGRADWGLGLGTEAARGVRDLAFGPLGLARVVSIIHRGNLASRRVAEKVGMRHERIVQFADHRCSLYAMAASDPRP